MRRLLHKVGNPHLGLRTILVGGTNGKGSTVGFIASILEEAGYRVGVYTSPHLLDLNERIRCNGRKISRSELAKVLSMILPYCRSLPDCHHPTFFEVITTAAFLFFKEKRPDFVILEVGLGGRYDATNVVDPSLSIICSISLDHTDVLGEEIEDIAREKAGIIRKGKWVISNCDRRPSIVLEKLSARKGAEFFDVRERTTWKIKKREIDYQVFDLFGLENDYRDLKIGLLGEHQVMNAATSLSAINILKHSFKIDDRSIRKGLEKARNPGRFEIVKRAPIVVFDVSHNLEGIKEAIKTLGYLKYRRLIIVFGVLKDKDIGGMSKVLTQKADLVVITRPKANRAAAPDEVYRHLSGARTKIKVVEDVSRALKLALGTACRDDLVLVCGSHFTVAEAMKAQV
jgi:dihydrofolate synthase/folylpolyglutamate synthase